MTKAISGSIRACPLTGTTGHGEARQIVDANIDAAAILRSALGIEHFHPPTERSSSSPTRLCIANALSISIGRIASGMRSQVCLLDLAAARYCAAASRGSSVGFVIQMLR